MKLQALLTAEDICKRTEQIGKQISQDFSGEKLILICTLKGATVFTADLARAITLDCRLGFIRAKSYSGTQSTGCLDISFADFPDIKGENVIIVEDIVDTGRTIKALSEHLKALNPKTLKICSLLNKQSRREVDVKPDYCGFEIEDRFVVGYGLDYNEQFRTLPYIAEITEL